MALFNFFFLFLKNKIKTYTCWAINDSVGCILYIVEFLFFWIKTESKTDVKSFKDENWIDIDENYNITSMIDMLVFIFEHFNPLKWRWLIN